MMHVCLGHCKGPSQFYWGVAAPNIALLIFQPIISLYIYYHQCEEIWRKKQHNLFSAFRFHGYGERPCARC